MKDIRALMKGLGYSDKEIAVYLAVLSSGPAPVRKIGLVASINRGTTYDLLKSLMEDGLVSYYHEEKKQYFVAEDPERLLTAIDAKIERLAETKSEMSEILPQLKSIFARAGEKPVVKYYEGLSGVKRVLSDVLESSVGKSYAVYSSANIREILYRAFPDFTNRRIKAKIAVRAISIGHGGEEAPLSERRWLTGENKAPTYMLIYPGKVAMISVGANNEPRGVILEDAGTFATQMLLFENLWSRLKSAEQK